MENLPLPGKFATMWQNVPKMVDGLHTSNHRREICETDFHPKRFKEANPDLTPNSMAAEQTFAWMGRYKKQICSLPKLQQMFMMHRLCKRQINFSRNITPTPVSG